MTQHGLTRVGLESPTSESGVRGINHQATALPEWNIVMTMTAVLKVRKLVRRGNQNKLIGKQLQKQDK